jgi:hypothetical protein
MFGSHFGVHWTVIIWFGFNMITWFSGFSMSWIILVPLGVWSLLGLIFPDAHVEYARRGRQSGKVAPKVSRISARPQIPTPALWPASWTLAGVLDGISEFLTVSLGLAALGIGFVLRLLFSPATALSAIVGILAGLYARPVERSIGLAVLWGLLGMAIEGRFGALRWARTGLERLILRDRLVSLFFLDAGVAAIFAFLVGFFRGGFRELF